jgi:hypothetical protein
MMPGSIVCYTCNECNIVYHLGVVPASEWCDDAPEVYAVHCCPFCGSVDVKAQHDLAVRT